MAYSTSSQVADEIKALEISGTTALTDTVVDRWIEEVDAEIDARISHKYDTPVTGSNSLLILRRVSTGKVIQRVNGWRRVKTGETENNQEPGDQHGKMAEQILKQIEKGTLVLPDADAANTHLGIQSYSDNNSEEYTFKKNVDQW